MQFLVMTAVADLAGQRADQATNLSTRNAMDNGVRKTRTANYRGSVHGKILLMRYRFWSWVHDSLEHAWHWVYYHKMHPEYRRKPASEPTFFMAVAAVDSDGKLHPTTEPINIEVPRE